MIPGRVQLLPSTDMMSTGNHMVVAPYRLRRYELSTHIQTERPSFHRESRIDDGFPTSVPLCSTLRCSPFPHLASPTTSIVYPFAVWSCRMCRLKSLLRIDRRAFLKFQQLL